MHVDSSLNEEGYPALKLCRDDKTQVEEIQTAEKVQCTSLCQDCNLTHAAPFITFSVKDDPFHADWPFW
jgi:hypothetical protein